jgi:hypothetical protein
MIEGIAVFEQVGLIQGRLALFNEMATPGLR